MSRPVSPSPPLLHPLPSPPLPPPSLHHPLLPLSLPSLRHPLHSPSLHHPLPLFLLSLRHPLPPFPFHSCTRNKSLSTVSEIVQVYSPLPSSMSRLRTKRAHSLPPSLPPPSPESPRTLTHTKESLSSVTPTFSELVNRSSLQVAPPHSPSPPHSGTPHTHTHTHTCTYTHTHTHTNKHARTGHLACALLRNL